MNPMEVQRVQPSTANQKHSCSQICSSCFFLAQDPPKPVPGQDDPMAMASVSSMVKRMQGQPVTEAQRIEKHNAQVEAKRATIRMQRAARARRAARKGITGTRNI